MISLAVIDTQVHTKKVDNLSAFAAKTTQATYTIIGRQGLFHLHER